MIGLTGGIGSGKSTVSDLLAGKGALVLDTDTIAREVIEPGRPAYAAVVDRFGPGVAGADGGIDRAALADLAFSNPEARHDLDAIVHPAVAAVADERLAALAGTDSIVVLVVPLLVEADWTGRVDHVVVVDCPEDVAVRRLVESGRMSEPDARRRVAAQATRATRLAHADTVITNDGPLDDLTPQTEALWQALHALRRTGDR